MFAVMDVVLGISKLFVAQYQKADAEKTNYTLKLEHAAGEDVFKYLLLINVAALESYVAQTRIQAEQSFRLSRIVAVIGFVLITVGIGLSALLTSTGRTGLEPAYLSSVAGILTEFIAGVFFFLYNKTLQQINLFHDKLAASQQVSMAFLANSLIADPARRDEVKAELAKNLMLTTITGLRPPPAA